MSGQYLTNKQIEVKYPNQWVLVDQLKRDRQGHKLGGVVISHGTDKEAVLRITDSLPKPFNIAFYYTGPISEDIIFIL